VWNLAVVAALNSGGRIDEIDRACRPIREAAPHGSDVGTADYAEAPEPAPAAGNTARLRVVDKSSC